MNKTNNECMKSSLQTIWINLLVVILPILSFILWVLGDFTLVRRYLIENDFTVYTWNYSGVFDWGFVFIPVSLFCGLLLTKMTHDALINIEDKLGDEKKLMSRYTLKFVIVFITIYIISYIISYISFTQNTFLMDPNYENFLFAYKIKYLVASCPYVALLGTIMIYTFYNINILMKILQHISKPDSKFKYNPFHEDQIGGFKQFGNIALLNGFNFTLQLSILFSQYLFQNFESYSDGTSLLKAIGVLLLLAGSAFIVFYIPIKKIFKLSVNYKAFALKKINDKIIPLYMPIVEDVEGKELTREDIIQFKESNESLKSFLELKAEVDKVRVFPWDLKTMGQFSLTYIIPILTVVLKMFFNISLESIGLG